MNVEILTPRKLEFKEEAECVVLPTLAGEIAVLSDHASLISVLKPGKIKIRTSSQSSENLVSSPGSEIKNKDREKSFEIEGGVAEIAENSVVILLKKFYNA
jgi:F-type H+-transporting ATPase subunit epsilon